MAIWIDIQDAAGVKYGDGPILTAQSWETTARLDKAGTFSFKLPLSDPRAQLIKNKREAWCYTVENGQTKCVGAGIIDQIEVDAVDLTMTVSGSDLLRQLNNNSVGYLEIVTRDAAGNGYASPDALALLMAEAPTGWSLDTANGHAATAEEVYASFSGQSVLNALITVADNTGEHFRLGEGKKLVWLQGDITASGVRAIQNSGDPALETNADVCLITSLTEAADSYDLITRIFAYGSGNANARTSLADATVTPHAGYVIDKSNPKGANLTASAPFAEYGKIERYMSWKDITPVSNTEADIEAAGNALYGAAYQYLSKYSVPQTSYKLSVTKLHRAVYPGQQIRVVYRRVVDDYLVIDLDRDLTVLESSVRYDDNGVQTVALEVSTVAAWPTSFADLITSQIEETRLLDGYPQTYAGYYSEGLGNYNISPANSAIARLKFDDRITRLVSAQLRFRTDAFEATATAAASKTISLTSTKSQTINLTSTKTKAHDHDMRVLGIGAAGQPVYFDGTALRTNGISGEVLTEQDSHSHGIEMPGHSHSIEMPAHDHALTYGITRSSTYPGGLTIWIDGEDKTYELTGQTSIGTTTGSTGVVEYEIADLLNENFRSEHTIELKCASGQGRVLNMALRCFVIVQAILVLPTAASTTDPGTPAAPTVNVAATADGWRVTWLAVSGATSYRVYGNTTNSDTGATEVTLTTSRETLIPYSAGLNWFAATAIAGTHESDIGPWATDTTTPAAPTWSSHVYQTDGHYLTWYHADMARVKNFVLYRNAAAEDAGAQEVATLDGTVLAYTIPYATGDYFGIKAVSWAGYSSTIVWSQNYTRTPDLPRSVSGSISSAGFLITWQAPEGTVPVKEYVVYSAADETGEVKTERWRGTALASAPLAYTSDEYFWVEALGLDSSASEQVATGQIDPTPATPSQPLAQMVEIGGYVVSWAAISNALRYEVQTAADVAGTGAKLAWAGSALQTGVLKESGFNYFQVRAVGYDESASDYTAWLTDTSAPDTPAVELTGSVETATISFLATDTSHLSPGIDYYKVERATASDGTGAVSLDAARPYGGFPYVVGQLETYMYYRLTAYDITGNASTPTGWIECRTGGDSFQEDFSKYGADSFQWNSTLHWMQLVNFNKAEAWVGATPVRYDDYISDANYHPYFVNCLLFKTTGLVTTVQTAYLDKAINLQNFDGNFAMSYRWEARNDYTASGNYTASETWKTGIKFTDSAGLTAYYERSSINELSSGWVRFMKSGMTVASGFSWSGIVRITVYWQNTGYYSGVTYNYDLMEFSDLRIDRVGSDIIPRDSSDGIITNATGGMWKSLIGATYDSYHIYSLAVHENKTGSAYAPNKQFCAGSPDLTGSNAYLGTYYPTGYQIYRDLAKTNVVNGQVKAGIISPSSREYGVKYAGVRFYVKDVNSANTAHLNMYEFEAQVGIWYLRRKKAGAVTALLSGTYPTAGIGASKYASMWETKGVIWLGVDLNEFRASSKIKVYASFVEGDLFNANNLLGEVGDSAPLAAGGSVGVYGTGFVAITAGSPPHAEIADIAYALHGPIMEPRGDGRVFLSITDRETVPRLQASVDAASWFDVAPRGAITFTRGSNLSVSANTLYSIDFATTANQVGTNFYSYSSGKYAVTNAGYYVAQVALYFTKTTDVQVKLVGLYAEVYTSADVLVDKAYKESSNTASDTGDHGLNRYGTTMYIADLFLLYIPAGGYVKLYFKSYNGAMTLVGTSTTYVHLKIARVA